MSKFKRKRQPTHPGELLKEEFLLPANITQRYLAEHLGCDIKVINRLVNAKTGVSVQMALKLSAALNTTPDFWLNAQKAYDLYQARLTLNKLPKPLNLH